MAEAEAEAGKDQSEIPGEQGESGAVPFDISAVPYIYRPGVFWATVVACTLSWLLLVIGVRDARPWVVESVVALTVALVVARMVTPTLAVYVCELMASATSHRYVKIMPVVPGDAWQNWLSAGRFAVMSAIAVAGVVWAGWLVAPDLGWPWAHYSSVSDDGLPIQSMSSAVMLYLPAVYTFVGIYMLRWYRRVSSASAGRPGTCA